ncbi:MAG TPA: YcxB family protein [Hanamia sp.]|nr:YcxB family protein [Hanamia sp.]
MQEFTVTTRITKTEYARIVFFGYYKQTGSILFTIFGLYLVIIAALTFLEITPYYSGSPSVDLIEGMIFLSIVPLNTWRAVRKYGSNGNFQKGVTYTFSENDIKVETENFKGEYLCAYFIKQKESGKYLIVSHPGGTGILIDKTALTAEQLQFIRSKVAHSSVKAFSASAAGRRAKSRKKSNVIIPVIIFSVLLTSICLYNTFIWSNKDKLDFKEVSKEYVGYSNNFNREYVSLFTETAQKKLTDTGSFLSKVRNPFCNAVYDNKYNLLIYKIELAKDIQLDTAIGNNHGAVGGEGTFLVDDLGYFNLDFRQGRVSPASEFLLTTVDPKTEVVLTNETAAYYFLPGGGFSVKYGKDSTTDFYVEDEASIFTQGKTPKSILFLKRNKSVYFLMMFPGSEDGKLPKDLLYLIVKK